MAKNKKEKPETFTYEDKEYVVQDMKEEEQVCTISKNPSTVTVVQYTVREELLFVVRSKNKKEEG